MSTDEYIYQHGGNKTTTNPEVFKLSSDTEHWTGWTLLLMAGLVTGSGDDGNLGTLAVISNLTKHYVH